MAKVLANLSKESSRYQQGSICIAIRAYCCFYNILCTSLVSKEMVLLSKKTQTQHSTFLKAKFSKKYTWFRLPQII